MEIGNTLKNARESKGISLEKAEENTKIRRKYLEALENENYDVLPGKVYIKGFLRNYASFLGLNGESIASAYDSGTPAAEKEEEKTGDTLTHIEKRRNGGIIKAVISLAVILAAAYFILPHLAGAGKGGVNPPPITDNKSLTGNKTPQVSPPAEDQNKVPVQTGVNLTLNVTDDTSWMYVEVDGKSAFTGTLESGQAKEFKGSKRIFLKLGNAGVVEVEFNGQKMGVLGGRGVVVNKEFKAPQG